MSAPRLGYRPDIDGMRAIAVGLVVIFHFRLLPVGGAGFMGVDIFFVISGFLITRIILDGLDRGDFGLAGFYLARIRRLYPALLATMALYLAAGWVLFLPDRFEELAIEAALSQLYVVNIYFWRTVNYFGLMAKEVPLLHMWSLAVEEQFYIFYPLFLILLHRFARAWLWPVLALTTLASFALGWVSSGWKPQAAFYLLPTRAWELGVGGLVAVLLMRVPGRLPGAAAAGPLGLGLIALALAIHVPDMPFPGWLAALPVLGAAALIVAGTAPGTLVPRLLSWPAMLWIGRISYPLYLVHWPVAILLEDSLPQVPWAARAGGLALSVLLAWAITDLVEAPVRRRRVLAGARSFLSAAGLGTAVLLAVSALGWQTGGLPGRFDPEVARLLAHAEDRDMAMERCDWPSPPCPIGPEGPATLALIGDSHALVLAPAMALHLDRQDRPGALVFGSACLPVPGLGDARCAAFAEAAIARAESDPVLETVVISSIWRQAYEGAGLRVGPDFLSGRAAHKAFETALVEMVGRLRAAGKQVILIEPLYAAPRFVPRTLARNRAFGTDWPVDLPLADHRAQFARAYEAFEAAEAAGAERVSLIGELCADGTCPGTLDGAPVFFDNNHIRLGLAPYFAEVLGRVMPRP